MKRSLVGVALIAAVLCGSPSAAKINVSSATISAGTLQVSGQTAPGTQISLDGGHTVTSGRNGRFAFSIVYHPPTCIVTLTAGADVRQVVVANCSSEKGPPGNSSTSSIDLNKLRVPGVTLYQRAHECSSSEYLMGAQGQPGSCVYRIPERTCNSTPQEEDRLCAAAAKCTPGKVANVKGIDIDGATCTYEFCEVTCQDQDLGAAVTSSH